MTDLDTSKLLPAPLDVSGLESLEPQELDTSALVPTEGEAEGFFARLGDEFVDVGQNLKIGAQSSISGFYQTAANAVRLINVANDRLVEQTGIGEKSENTVLKDVETKLLEFAERTAPTETPTSDGTAADRISDAVFQGLGGAPLEVGQFVIAGKTLGQVPGLAGLSALKESDEGAEAAIEAGLHGGATGALLGAVGPLSTGFRASTLGGTVAASEFLAGSSLEETAAAGITFGLLSATSPGGPITPRKAVAQMFAPPSSLRMAQQIRTEERAKPVKSKATTKQPKLTKDDFADAKVEAAKHRLSGEQEFAGNIRLSKIQAPKDVIELIKKTAAENKDFTHQRRGKMSFDQMQSLAETAGVTSKQLQRIGRKQPGTILNAEQALQAEMIFIDSANNVVRLARLASERGSPKDLLNFKVAQEQHVLLQKAVSGIRAEQGRALVARRIVNQSEGAKRAKALDEAIDTLGGRSSLIDDAAAIASLETPAGVSKYVRAKAKPKASDIAVEIWINSLLSNPQTQAVNALSNALNAYVFRPTVEVTAGAIGKVRGKGTGAFKGREILARTIGTIEGTKDGLRAAARAFQSEQATDLSTKLEFRRQQSTPGKLGRTVRLPGRMLLAADEFFKSVNYRAELNGLAARQALKEGGTSRQVAERMHEIRNNPTNEIIRKAKDTAEFNTFTNPLGRGGRSIQVLTNEHPTLKLIAPFIRTPTNIVKFAGKASPLAPLMPSVRAVFKSGDQVAINEVIARMVIGSGISSAVGSYVIDGRITGGGPSDMRERSLWLEENQPYSLFLNGKWHAYNRFEPIGMLFGVTADTIEIYNQVDEKDLDQMAAMVGFAVSRNLTSKTWLRGLSEAVQALEDPVRYGDNWVKNLAGTLVPSGVAQIARITDPVLRDTRSDQDPEAGRALNAIQEVLNVIKSRTPGLSETLPARVGVFGEDIRLEGSFGPDLLSPIYQKTPANDKTVQELIRLKIRPSLPQRQLRDTDLTASEYRDLQRVGGQIAKKVLDEFINDPSWALYPDFAKEEVIGTVLRDSRAAARAIIFEENKPLQKRIIENAIEQVKEITEVSSEIE